MNKSENFKRVVAGATLTLVAGGIALVFIYLYMMLTAPAALSGELVDVRDGADNDYLEINVHRAEGAVRGESFRAVANNEQELAEKEPATLEASAPERIIIPRLEVDAYIQSVGLTATGNMATPSGANKYKNVAWYGGGAAPGKIGNAVIAGHLDNGYGRDAVFSNLAELQIGDLVFVLNKDGSSTTFEVVDRQFYDYQSAPSEAVFGPSESVGLNLITCDGDWISSEGQYSQRLVVYTRAVN